MKSLFAKKHKQNNEKMSNAKLPSQAYIIRSLLESCGYKNYLELGVYFGTTYNYIKPFVEVAHAVDMEFKNFIDKNKFKE